MTPIPAKVLTVEKQSSQYRVRVQIELDRYLGSFHTLRFGESKPFTGACHNGQVDLSITEILALRQESRSHSGRFSDLVTLPLVGIREDRDSIAKAEQNNVVSTLRVSSSDSPSYLKQSRPVEDAG